VVRALASGNPKLHKNRKDVTSKLIFRYSEILPPFSLAFAFAFLRFDLRLEMQNIFLHVVLCHVRLRWEEEERRGARDIDSRTQHLRLFT
jgi:hypothetical protein